MGVYGLECNMARSEAISFVIISDIISKNTRRLTSVTTVRNSRFRNCRELKCYPLRNKSELQDIGNVILNCKLMRSFLLY